MPYTSGFLDQYLRRQHFIDHRTDFGAKDEIEYELMADEFLGAPLPLGTLECVRGAGDIIRFNPASNEFGVLSRSGIIRTYYKPNIRIHGMATNLDYFRAECRKVRK